MTGTVKLLWYNLFLHTQIRWENAIFVGHNYMKKCMHILQGLKLLQKAKKDRALVIKDSRKEGGRPGNMRRIFRGKMKMDIDDDDNEDNDELHDLEAKIK
jgi:hypothetical protein